MTVSRRRDVPLDGSAPCLLYGYGAYESSLWPEWEVPVPSLLDRGVVYAVAHIRGGGEMGRGWWLDGHLAAKQHSFDDHIAVADALADGLVDGSRIVTRGLSAGGLLQGAVFSQRPDRWAGVIAEVPFVDVVTTMLDPDLPLTAAEWDEWGDPRKPEEFAWMLAYSPYDNLPAGGNADRPAGHRGAQRPSSHVLRAREVGRRPSRERPGVVASMPPADGDRGRCARGAERPLRPPPLRGGGPRLGA